MGNLARSARFGALPPVMSRLIYPKRPAESNRKRERPKGRSRLRDGALASGTAIILRCPSGTIEILVHEAARTTRKGEYRMKVMVTWRCKTGHYKTAVQQFL